MSEEWMEISLNTVITKITTASKKSAWDSQRLSNTTPLTAVETEGSARNTRKASNPLWLKEFIPQQCLSIFLLMQNPRAFIVLGRDLHVLVGVDEEPA